MQSEDMEIEPEQGNLTSQVWINDQSIGQGVTIAAQSKQAMREKLFGLAREQGSSQTIQQSQPSGISSKIQKYRIPDSFNQDEQFPQDDYFNQDEQFPQDDYFNQDEQFPQDDYFNQDEQFPQDDSFDQDEQFPQDQQFGLQQLSIRSKINPVQQAPKFGMFYATQQAPQAQQVPQQISGFHGGPQQVPLGGFFGAPQQAPTGHLFGAPQQPSPNSLFAAPQQPSPNSLFAASQQASPNSLFAAPQQAPTSSLFAVPQQAPSFFVAPQQFGSYPQQASQSSYNMPAQAQQFPWSSYSSFGQSQQVPLSNQGYASQPVYQPQIQQGQQAQLQFQNNQFDPFSNQIQQPIPQQIFQQQSSNIQPYPSLFSNYSFLQYEVFDEQNTYDDDEDIQDTSLPQGSINQEGAVDCSITPLKQKIQKSDDQIEIPVILTLKGSEASIEEIEKSRLGLDIVCVIDISGSMQGPKINLVKQTLDFLHDNLTSKDRLSLVLFENKAYRLMEFRCCHSDNSQGIKEVIESIQSSGGTDIEGGLKAGLKVLNDRKTLNKISSLILLTDGCDNTPGTILQRCRISLNQYHNLQNLKVHCLGFGSDHDASLLPQIAELKQGNYYFIETIETVSDAFANLLGELVAMIADDVQVNLSIQPPFEFGQIYTDTGANFKMFPIFSSSRKDSVFTLKFTPNEVGMFDSVTADIAFVLVKNEDRVNQQIKLQLEVVEQDPQIHPDKTVILNFYRVSVAQAIREAVKFGESNQFQQGRDLLQMKIEELQQSEFVNDSLVQTFIKDLQDSCNRIKDNQSWQTGGQAAMNSFAASHQNQGTSMNVCAYQQPMQSMYLGKSNDIRKG